nr:BPK_HP1_G0044120.mRNA.1.CDS.1 [Saccharomyces cerevisiae]
MIFKTQKIVEKFYGMRRWNQFLAKMTMFSMNKLLTKHLFNPDEIVKHEEEQKQTPEKKSNWKRISSQFKRLILAVAPIQI